MAKLRNKLRLAAITGPNTRIRAEQALIKRSLKGRV